MILNDYSSDTEFQLAELAEPSVKFGHVVVCVATTSVNTVDTMIRQPGQEQLPISPDLPALLGMDFAGTIESVGEGITGYAPRDQIVHAQSCSIATGRHYRL